MRDSACAIYSPVYKNDVQMQNIRLDKSLLPVGDMCLVCMFSAEHSYQKRGMVIDATFIICHIVHWSPLFWG